MGLSEVVWRVLIGPDHKAKRARRKERKIRRAARKRRSAPAQIPGEGGRRQLIDGAGRVWTASLRLTGDLRDDAGDNSHPGEPRANDAHSETPAFELLASRPRASGWIRARRALAVTALVVVVLAGLSSIIQTAWRWIQPTSAPSPVQLSDTALAGAAMVAATDYMSWDTTDRPRRQAALRRIAAPDVNIDGWDGTGRQVADSATPIAQNRIGADRAVVIIQVRITPFTQLSDNSVAPPSPTPSTADNNAASAPAASAPGWVARTPRWLTLAIPLSLRDRRLVVTTTPSLVANELPLALASTQRLTGTADDSFAKSTEDTVTKFLQSYASGDLDYVRAPHATVPGLNGAVSLKKLVRWQVAKPSGGDDGSERIGTAVVTWELPDNSGTLRSAYRISIRKHEDRWLLASINAETEGGTA